MESLETFSLHETTLRLAKRLELEIDPIEGGLPADGGDDRNSSFSATELAMRAWCRRNERLVSDRRVEGVEVYAGFERLSRVRGVRPRYVKIAAASSSLTLFGENDWDPAISGARLVHLTRGPLTREWFLLIHCRDYKALLCARDIEGLDNGKPTHLRRFEGIKTVNPQLVEAARRELLDVIDV